MPTAPACVDGHGDRFSVKGINLGNWLVPEGYMFKFETRPRAERDRRRHRGADRPEQAARFWSEFRDDYVAEDDIRFIKAAGFNTVRVPLHWRLFVTPGDGGGPDRSRAGLALLDRLVAMVSHAGLRVILDLHAAPGGQTGVNHDDGTGFPLTFYVPRYRALTIALWRALAAHYRDEPAILGYDLFNEPISPYSDENYLNPRLEPLYRDIVAAIRERRYATMWCCSPAHNGVRALPMFGRPFDANAVYTYHKFWATPDARRAAELSQFQQSLERADPDRRNR